jgi:recombination DNA repair RAD52 pathway protein
MEPSAPASDESSTFGAIHDWAMENEQAQQQEGEDTNKLYQQVHPQAQPQPKSDDRIIIEHIDQITTQPSPTFVKRPHPQKSAIISSIFTFKDTLYSVSLTHDGILWTRQTSSGAFSIL